MITKELLLDLDTFERRAFLAEPAELNDDNIERHKVSILEIWVECYGNAAKDLDVYKAKEIRKVMAAFKDWEADVIRIKVRS